jgi:hypothetical protein
MDREPAELMSGMWQEKRMVWFRGEKITINIHWVVALIVEQDVLTHKLMVKTLEGGYWRLAEGTKEEMTSLMNQLIR